MVLNLIAHLSPHFCCIHSISVLVSLGAQTCWKSRPPKLRPLWDSAPSWGRSSFWGAHQRDCSLRTTTSSTSRRSPLHIEHLHGIDFDRLHQQARLAMSGNGTSGSFGTSPASGYFLNFMFMFIVFVTNTLDHALNFIYKNVIIYALIFEIKINHNWPLIPTASRIRTHPDRSILY